MSSLAEQPRETTRPESVVEIDVLVVGSGAAGFTAALTSAAAGLETLLVEKASYYGGTTTLSGGAIWVPNAPALARAGQWTEPEDLVTYLRAITGGEVPDELLRAAVTAGPQMMTFLEGLSPHLTFDWCAGYPDYYPSAPHGSEIGRSVEATPFDRRELGSLGAQLREPALRTPRGMWMRAVDLYDLVSLRRAWRGKQMMGRMLGRAATAAVTGRRIVTRGEALIGRLRLALRDSGTPLWLNSPVSELLIEDGVVVGAVVKQAAREVTVRTRRGVVLTTGGFDHNPEMRQEYQPFLLDHVGAGAPELTGDGIRLGQTAGADLALMDEAWWMPAIPWGGGRLGMLLVERQIAAQFTVDHQGRRFTNEAAPYNDFVHALIRAGCTTAKPAWLIIDSRAWKRNLFSTHLPLPRLPGAPVPTGAGLPPEWLESGAVRQADTWADLAHQIGVDEGVLSRTAATFNAMAAQGRDEEFHRGENAYDNYYGNARLKNPNLAPVEAPPYYAFAVVPSDLGTKGGLVIDTHARVLTPDGDPIPGLYAAGNTSASVMGRSYPGPGDRKSVV